MPQTGLSGSHDGLRPVGHLKLKKDVGVVVADDLGAQVQARGDLAVANALGYEVKDSTSQAVRSGNSGC